VGLPEDESIKATGSGAVPETGLPAKLTAGAPAPQPVTDGMTASDTIIRKKRAARKDLTWIGSESITIKKQLLIRSNSLLFKEIHVRDKKRFYFIFGYPPVTRDRSDIDHWNDHFKCKIPFLNGGLFDPMNNYDWVHTDIELPNELFSNDLLDLKTGEVKDLTTDKHMKMLPGIFGDTVVWVDSRNSDVNYLPQNWDVYIYDLKENKETRLTLAPTATRDSLAINADIEVMRGPEKITISVRPTLHPQATGHQVQAIAVPDAIQRIKLE